MGWCKQGAGQGGVPTSPATTSLQITQVPEQTWATKTPLC